MKERALLYTLIGLAEGVLWWVVLPFEETRPDPADIALLAGASTAALVYRFTGDDARRRGLVTAFALGAVVAAVSLRVAGLMTPEGAPYRGDDGRLVAWSVGAFAAVYIATPFAQIFVASGRLRFPYPELFEHSWNNAFVGGVALLFAGAAWAVLGLWGALFAMIGIDVFQRLFTSTPFAFIASFTLFGYGLALGRASESAIATLRRIALLMAQALLPVVCGVGLLFLATLPATGFGPLWNTGSATPLLLALIALVVLSLNARYEDGRVGEPMLVVRLLVRAGALALPVFAAIALYATSLRIRQHGLSPDRAYALVLVVIASLFGAGYAIAALLPGRWMRGIERVNVIVAVIAAALAIAIALPPLDPYRLSAESQIARLASGRVAVADFDFTSLRFDFGRYGWEALERIEELDPLPGGDETRAVIAAVRSAGGPWEVGSREPAVDAASLTRLPADLEIAPALAEAIRRDASLSTASCAPERCLLFEADLDDDGRGERCIVVLRTDIGSPDWLNGRCYAAGEGAEWRAIGRLAKRGDAVAPNAVQRTIAAEGPVLKPSPYRDVAVGADALVLVPIVEARAPDAD
jgi:hypothetical protein